MRPETYQISNEPAYRSSILSQRERLVGRKQRISPCLCLTAYRYPVVIRSFGDKRTEVLFRDERVRQFEGIARAAKRKLEALDAASRLENLTVPRSNRLEKLKGDLKDFHSIRINAQWRVIFKWFHGEP